MITMRFVDIETQFLILILTSNLRISSSYFCKKSSEIMCFPTEIGFFFKKITNVRYRYK